uniref:Uncharacterized protein n=1 Tax=Tanacetum cinerariifolium TaxID=118510 RepID=A0A6L2LA64_TANCI|nr:hypothetical protein [Tanacetum cinerariifolium]
MFNVVDVLKLNMTVSHPNGTKALVTHVDSLRLTNKIVIHDVLVVSGYQVSILSVQKLKDELLSESNDDERDSRSGMGKGTNQSSHVGTENTSDAMRDDAGHLDDSTSVEADCDNLESAIPDEKDSESEGDDTSYQDFNDYEPKSYTEAASDIRWVEAMNQEIEALNRNDNWRITNLPVGRKLKGKKEWCFDSLLVYVDDFIKTGNNVDEINRVKEFLSSKFLIKDLEFGMLSCRSYDTPLETKEYTTKHKKYMIAPLQSHLKLAFRVLGYLKNALGKGISLVKDKELNLNVFIDSDWVKYYIALNIVTCKVIWIQKVLSELNIRSSRPVPIYCDNNFAIQIAANPVFHEKTKHSKIELFFLIEKVSAEVVKTV